MGVALTSTAAGAWYYADELLRVRPDPPEFPLTVVAVTGSTVTLSGTGADQPGLLGVHWPGGYARVGPDVRVVRASGTAGTVVRGLRAYPDTPAVGATVRLDFYAAPLEPAELATVTGLDVGEIGYDGPLGRYPATYLPAAGGARWVVHVHGRGGSRAEGYRLMPALHTAGYPQLSVAYRNDDGAPADPGGEFGLGWTESDDLAAAVSEARARGARDVILAGYSMGGAIIGNYLRTHGSDGVAGVLYDAPALSWPDILTYQAAQRGMPRFAARVAATAVRWRAGVDLIAMDQVTRAERLDVPVFLAHGANDSTVPVSSSDALAAARPDLVTYLRTDAEHVQSWNVDPDHYETRVLDFLARLR
ncbi:hypothetical protein CLV30_106201 [Haloactinopolyspora alba]|uniref:Uncharacterized protein n=1 Tax=Haloactinopolyspora alba TaxID=648780 RepID=A0A2P8E410_9ACTN|nr:hypothetical protein CLV30_106201 [Haloactinopolyspora alba]